MALPGRGLGWHGSSIPNGSRVPPRRRPPWRSEWAGFSACLYPERQRGGPHRAVSPGATSLTLGVGKLRAALGLKSMAWAETVYSRGVYAVYLALTSLSL
jgi:hypothetical protein